MEAAKTNSAGYCPHCWLLVDPNGQATEFGSADVLDSIREAARQLGEPPERLLMVDYQQIATADPNLPQLRDVFAAYGSWKGARREAASALGPAEDG